MRKYLLLILLLSFLIRLIALNQSLWLDEGTTAKVVKDYSYIGIVAQFAPSDFHPPLFYLLEKLWTSIFGYSEIALRLPSVLFSLLTGWVLFLIGGIWMAVFFLFNPLIIYYSQEARMYSMATFLLTGALYYLLKSLRVKGLASYVLFTIFSIAAFYTFYGSIFLIVPMYLCLLYKKKYQILFVSGFAFAVSLLIISPLLYRQLTHSREALKIVVNWSNVLGKASLKNLLLIPLKFSFGRISFYPKILYYSLSGLWTILVGFFVIRGGIKNKLYLFLFLTPLLLGLVFSFLSPLLQYFRFLYLIPILAVLIQSGTKTTVYRYVVVSGFFILSLIYLLNPQFHREDWKSLAQKLPTNIPVYVITSSMDALTYYKNIHINDVKEISQTATAKLVVIPYTVDIFGFDYKTVLKSKDYFLKNSVNFRELQYEEWSR